MRIAILADIHGNLPALEAVAKDLKQQSPDAVYLAGDQVNRCPWNNEVLDLIAAEGWHAIAGNHDLIIGIINTPKNYPPFTDPVHSSTLWWTQSTLRKTHLETIRRWPEELTIDYDGLPSIRLVHGVPGNAFVGILPEDPDTKVRQLIGNVTESVLVCGHIHRPLARKLNRWTIYNGGSVGTPYNSDPRAHYLLLDGSSKHTSSIAVAGTWQPIWRRVDYDRTTIPLAFDESGMRAATGPIAELNLRTVMQGEPWISDFGHWIRTQKELGELDMENAVATYLKQYGPGN